ncbi:uncharacterized protein LOC100905120 [Galendromus occidentalis]|uniref:Uncharacterized protein LOC100905120 n=1 Tax=Galendromus occidentalis TaxID=34638 RepID=A0AAJ7L8F4_9ACAR|nr:uncharacterized protein LOC100905120 [Galendromus occidentalis]
MEAETKETSGALLALEHASKEEHIGRLFSQNPSKPKIERLSSSVLQRVQKFLPELHDANEVIANSDEGRETLSCEVGENFDGPAVEMTLMLTKEDEKQTKIIEVLENDSQSESSDSESAAEEESDSSSDEL